MAAHTPVDPDPKQVESAQNVWDGFTKLMKYSIILCVATLVILGLAFIDW